MNNKYSLQKAYGTTPTGRDRVIWNVIETINGVVFVVDTFSLRRDAKYYMDQWNKAADYATRDEWSILQ